MSRQQQRPQKKSSLLSRIFCCAAPGLEAEHVAGTSKNPNKQSSSGTEAKKVESERPTGTQDTTKLAGSEKPRQATVLSDVAHESEHGAKLGTDVPNSATLPSEKDSEMADDIEIAPAIVYNRNSTSALPVISPGTETNQLAAEEKALAKNQPLTPSSAAITATIPLPDETQNKVISSVGLTDGSNRADTSWLLPTLSSSLTGKKCLVLDLDETLVHSSFKIIHQADFVVPVEIDGIYHNVYVIKRPGVDEFMRIMGDHFEIVVFTASLAKYADPVLDMLDIHKVVHHRLFRESCHNHMGNYVKDLSQLGRDLKDAIIIDNSPASYVFHPAHAVPISSWFNDVHDTELVDLIPFLLDLTTVDDVSQVLELSL